MNPRSKNILNWCSTPQCGSSGSLSPKISPPISPRIRIQDGASAPPSTPDHRRNLSRTLSSTSINGTPIFRTGRSSSLSLTKEHPGGADLEKLEELPYAQDETGNASPLKSATSGDAAVTWLNQFNLEHRNLYTQADRITDIINEITGHMGVDFPDLGALVVCYLPLYSWTPDPDDLKIETSHLDIVVENTGFSFGVVQGTYLNPAVDHVINIKIFKGEEFGVGVCNAENSKLEKKRDFMCEAGGWGYYNYRAKREGSRPKYPPGFYQGSHKCDKRVDKGDIMEAGDIITLVVARKGIYQDSTPELGNGFYTMRYFKNGGKMGFECDKMRGPLYLCLNYYFMNSKAMIQSSSECRVKRSELQVHYRHEEFKNPI